MELFLCQSNMFIKLGERSAKAPGHPAENQYPHADIPMQLYLDHLKHGGYQDQVDVCGSIFSGHRLTHSVRLKA